MKTAGVVLAGGESRRFGQPKAFALHNGKFFYERALAVLKTHIGETVIVARAGEESKFEGCRVIVDDPLFRGMGPLAGLHSAMKNISSDWYCVMACDMPLMTEETIERLVKTASALDRFDAVVPVIERRTQPLAAMYHHSTFEVLESLLARDIRMVKKFLDEIHPYEMEGLDPLCFKNVNTKADFDLLKGERRL
ncbi:MAG TPA: molybdenum cofactor guanylyltransferase [Bacillales bacterium]|nr:molybdenum cofactor guanylyltransferase [Bacillales bacterium]